MKRIVIAIQLTVLVIATAYGQITFPADANKKASVSEDISNTTVKVNYSRPEVKGREGKIWGQLVHYGFAGPALWYQQSGSLAGGS